MMQPRWITGRTIYAAIALLLSGGLGLALTVSVANAETLKPCPDNMAEMSRDRPESSNSTSLTLNSTSWQLSQSMDNRGQWIAPIAGTELTATFDSTGQRLSGSAGCNRYFASYQQDAAQLTIGMVGSTRKACAGTINQQEQAFFELLAKTRSYQIEGDRLTLYDAQKQAIAMFQATADA